MSGIPWPVLRAVGLVVPVMREVVDVRHQFDQEYVIDATRDHGDLRAGRDPVGGDGARDGGRGAGEPSEAPAVITVGAWSLPGPSSP